MPWWWRTSLFIPRSWCDDIWPQIGTKTERRVHALLCARKAKMSSVITTKDASLSSSSSTSNRKKKQNSFISRLLSRIVLPLILVLFVSDVLFYETEETKLRSVAKREETRVGSHKIDNHRQHSYRHQNEYNNEVLVRDGKPEEIAEIHDATKTTLLSANRGSSIPMINLTSLNDISRFTYKSFNQSLISWLMSCKRSWSSSVTVVPVSNPSKPVEEGVSVFSSS